MMAEAGSAGDRRLTVSRAARIIGSQFPELAPVRLVPVGRGEDFDVFRVNRRWLFRFPRRKTAGEKLRRELALLPAIASALNPLPLRIPRYEKFGQPSRLFSRPFAGYRFIPGVTADRLAAAKLDKPLLARRLGRTLARLHGMDSLPLARLGVPRDTTTPRGVLRRIRGRARELRAILPSGLLHPAREYLSGGLAAPPAYSGPPRFLHNDVCPDHLLVNPARGLLSGLVDFSDAALGDPALDFANLCSWLGRAFIRELWRWYDAPGDAQFERRITFYARALSLLWLGDAARRGEASDLAKHRRWVRRAFQD
jgi:aminoglycoside phosphotransferase (APT) family kinase protein